MTDFPTLLYTPYPFIYLKPEKGAPFGRCPVLAIIGITPLLEVHISEMLALMLHRAEAWTSQGTYSFPIFP